MRSVLKKLIISLTAMTVLISMSSGCSNNGDISEQNEEMSNDTTINTEIIEEVNKIEFTFEEKVRVSTHIAKAVYEGDTITDNHEEMKFSIVNEIKGDIPDEDAYVNFDEIPEGGYTVGETYVLLMSRHVSVYRVHDRYSANDIIPEKDADIDKIEALLAEDPGRQIEKIGYDYTLSDDISEILDYSMNIFEVEVGDVMLEGIYAPTTVYFCTVTRTFTGEAAKNIQIVFFNDTVETGGRYIVLLSAVEPTSRIFSLSSRNSVYTPEEAAEIPELAELLKSD